MTRALVLAVVVACVHAPSILPREDCAGDAMYLSENERPRLPSGAVDAFCRPPQGPVEACEVKASIASLREKLDFSTGWRNTLIGIGYVFWILPGVGLYFLFDHQRDEASRDAEAAYQMEKAECLAVIPNAQRTPLAPGHAQMSGKAPVFCTVLTSDPQVGACAFDQATCARTRASYVAQGGAYDECRTFPSAACFLVDGNGAQYPFCAPSAADCERQLAAARKNPALRVRSAACDEYRVTP